MKSCCTAFISAVKKSPFGFMCSPITMSKTMTAALSGKRDSNPRPRPWQGRALPTELFPHKNQSQKPKVISIFD